MMKPSCKYPIESCRDTLTIMCGIAEEGLNNFDGNKRKETDFMFKNTFLPRDERRSIMDFPTLNVKVAHQYYGKLLGHRFLYRRRAAHYNTFIKDHFPYEIYSMLKRFGYNWYEFDPVKVKAAHRLKENGVLDELLRDNLIHLIPPALQTGLGPKDMKTRFGKALWKRIANSPKTKNHIIFSLSYISPEAYDLPYKFLGLTGGLDARVLRKIPRGPFTVRDAVNFFHQYNDTKVMFHELGWAFNPDWSFQRIKREHDLATAAIRREKYSSEPFCDPDVRDIGGFTFTKLVSPLQVKEEGDNMHHCVGSYARRCKEGYYTVYKVESEHERATLGITISINLDGETIYNYNQCYGHCNRRVSDDLEYAALRLVADLNKETE